MLKVSAASLTVECGGASARFQGIRTAVGTDLTSKEGSFGRGMRGMIRVGGRCNYHERVFGKDDSAASEYI